MTTQYPNNPNEQIKVNSDYLRGSLKQSLNDDITGAIRDDDQQVIKFHGLYQQDDRDIRQQRATQKLEPLYSFMIRARVPGGVCSPEQWLTMSKLADDYGNGTMRLTTRQAFQLHGIFKHQIKPTIQAMNHVLIDSIAACGDVNRNVMCNPNPVDDRAHLEVYEWAKKISEHLLPNTRAYHEIWLDEALVSTTATDEPIYSERYLPRKYKTVVAIPPYNDVDIFAHDMGFIAIIEHGQLLGFNVSVGGGMGMTFGDETTQARLAEVIGFVTPDRVLETAENIVKIQRDFGNRENRRLARFKYTIRERGLEWFKQTLNSRLGFEIANAKPFEFISNGDRYGWYQGFDGHWHLNLFIENGRIKEDLKVGLEEIAAIHQGDFRITPNQNLVIANITQESKPIISQLITRYGLDDGSQTSATRQNSMACVSLPTCSLAMAESERYLPSLLTQIETLLLNKGIAKQQLHIRMTGCPNGCARPYIAEVGLVGKAAGRYNLFLGGTIRGDKLGRLVRENLKEAEILALLSELLDVFIAERLQDESFGDFLLRANFVQSATVAKELHQPFNAFSTDKHSLPIDFVS
jgi:sulfite reductase (NADPH) hemoprotein beta-component